MGLRDGMPIGLAYLSVSFAFGLFAVGRGLSVLETIMISMTNLTSAGQLAAVPIICGGGSFIELAASQLFINLRYSLMSVSLSQRLGESVKLRHRFLIAFGNTDEVFAVSMARGETLGKKYLFGLILGPYIGWSTGTLLGAAAGSLLPSVLISALGIAIYGMFIALIVPEAKKRLSTALCILSAVALGCMFKYIPLLSAVPSGFVIILSAVPISLLFALVAPITDDEGAADTGKE